MDFDDAVRFHGHVCPGLATGYRVAQIAEEEFKGRAEDEELVAIVENKSCGIDAIQVVNGCTFGKGNLIFRDHGKHVYTFFRRGDNRAIRISSRPRERSGTSESEKDELFEKVRSSSANEDEMERFRERHHERVRTVLETPADQLFVVEHVQIAPPPKAMVYQSIPCTECGEEVMETRARLKHGQIVCLPCFEGHDI
ncbi:MAG: FmdE family protein [Euryarchaeota archaeon]|nr:FmdE family protein [Euryarchaeota archaeon]